jgi:hypothetical protein
MRPFMCLCFLKAQAHKKATANTGGTFFLAHEEIRPFLCAFYKKLCFLKKAHKKAGQLCF